MARELLSTGRAAKLFSVTPDTVLRWIKSGKLRATRTPGGHYRIDRSDLQALRPTRGAARRGPGDSIENAISRLRAGNGPANLALTTAEGEDLSSILEEGITSSMNVEVVNSAYELSAVVEGFRPDIVVLDTALGLGPALELANQIRADSRLETACVLLATGPGEVPRACRDGEIGRLEKPITAKRIEQCLRVLAETVRSRDAEGPFQGPTRSRRSARSE